jgi:hypothetical protein
VRRAATVLTVRSSFKIAFDPSFASTVLNDRITPINRSATCRAFCCEEREREACIRARLLVRAM